MLVQDAFKEGTHSHTHTDSCNLRQEVLRQINEELLAFWNNTLFYKVVTYGLKRKYRPEA